MPRKFLEMWVSVGDKELATDLWVSQQIIPLATKAYEIFDLVLTADGSVDIAPFAIPSETEAKVRAIGDIRKSVGDFFSSHPYTPAYQGLVTAYFFKESLDTINVDAEKEAYEQLLKNTEQDREADALMLVNKKYREEIGRLNGELAKLRENKNFRDKVEPGFYIFDRKKYIAEIFLNNNIKLLEGIEKEPWYSEYLSLITIRLGHHGLKALEKSFLKSVHDLYKQREKYEERNLCVLAMFLYAAPKDVPVPIETYLWPQSLKDYIMETFREDDIPHGGM